MRVNLVLTQEKQTKYRLRTTMLFVVDELDLAHRGRQNWENLALSSLPRRPSHSACCLNFG